MCERIYEFADSVVSEQLLPIRVAQYPDGRLGHASTVWDAALVMCAFLESSAGRALISGTRVIELGAGTGICSIAACALGATCVATDLDQYVPALRQNVEANLHVVGCTVEALDWVTAMPGTEAGKYDWIMLSDCVYIDALLKPLIATISSLSPRRGILTSNERREAFANSNTEAMFAAAMSQIGFVGRVVATESLRPEWRCSDIEVVVYEPIRKPAPVT
jgi:predicted nicotinamide N-methyase